MVRTELLGELSAVLGSLDEYDYERTLPWLAFIVLESKPSQASMPSPLVAYLESVITTKLGLPASTDPQALGQALRAYAVQHPPSNAALSRVAAVLRAALVSGATAQVTKSVIALLGGADKPPFERRPPATGEVRAGPFAIVELANKEK